MTVKPHLSRRTVLRGLGTAIGLPLLEGMIPRRLVAAAGKAKAPVRMAFLFSPNGKHMPDWKPETTGVLDKLPPIMQPLDACKSEMLALSGLSLSKEGGDHCGGHSCTVGQFLTCDLPKRTLGKDIRAGVSVDQIAAETIGDQTRFPSLELGCVPSKFTGDCDAGYSCVYTTNISWRTPTSPLPKEIDPRAVFDRLFANNIKAEVNANRSQRDNKKKSILDFVIEDADTLQRQLGIHDRRKLEEYLYAIRQIERRVQRATHAVEPGTNPLGLRPTAIPSNRDDHLRLMLDMIVLAFQTDSTRIVTLMLGNGSDNRSFPNLGISEGHHNLSHHVGSKKAQAKLSRINRHYMTHLSYFLEKLRSVSEADGHLLDNSMVLYGCAFGDGNAHDHMDLPIILAGRGGGTIQPGRHIHYEKGTPLANLYLSMLDRAGAPTERLGNSTGPLGELGA